MTTGPTLNIPGDDPAQQKVISLIITQVQARYGLDLSQDPVALERITAAVRQARRELEQRPEVEINLPYLSANAAGSIHLNRVLSRADFGLLSSGVREGAEPLDQASDAGAAPALRVKIELPAGKPVVTTVLMALTIAIYAVQLITGYVLGYDLPAALGMKANQLILQGQYWRLFTPIFLHGSPLHLGFNMYALYILGRRVERFYGSLRFLALYFIAGISGNIFSFYFTAAPSLGSSTAIFGLLGAEGIFIYQHRKLFGAQSRAALGQIVQVAVINLLIGLTPGIDNWGHVGGLIGGAIFSAFGGPRLRVAGSPPALRLENTRPNRAAGIGFVVQLIIMVGIVYLIILLRG